MATRTLLCVEPDAKDADFVREALAPYDFEVKNIVNGEQAIEWGKKNLPSAIMVCVEPRKVGYAICNKIKRSNELKDVPLILTSAEETHQTFEQHKKLRSRAEEYIIKPLQRSELLTKIKQLVGLGGKAELAGPSTREMAAEDSSEEIHIAENDMIEEKSSAAIQARSANGGGGAFGKNPDLDAIFDQETEAAFAAIQSQEGDSTGPVNSAEWAQPSPSEAANWNEDATHASHRNAMAFQSAVPRASYGLDGADVPPSPDDVMHPVASNDISVPINLAGADARMQELLGRVQELEEDKHRLEAESEELKARLQAQPLSKEKDILSLREIINRKEKDVLDLRDALDAKERQILDHKDRVREHERSRRDLEEKMLGFEKSLVAANERVTALSHDKEKSLERERGLKARLDDALTEIQKAHEEIDALKRRIISTEERGRSELDRVRGELERRIAEQEDAHKDELTRLADERSAADAIREREHQAEVARLEATRLAEVEGTQKRLGDELFAQGERAQSEIGKLRRDHEKALASLKEEHTLQLAAERQAHGESTEGKERDHRNEILGTRRRHEIELAGAEERRTKELTDAEARRIAELETAENRRRSELQKYDEEHHALVAEMDRRHFDEKTEMGERHRSEIDQASARAARAEGELAARNEELSEAHRRLGGREADIDALRADVRERDVKLAQSRDRTVELEAKTGELEEQILRAYQKLRSDEKMVDKAKRAVAVALSLLDGGTAAPQAAVPPAPSAPTPVAAVLARSEESST